MKICTLMKTWLYLLVDSIWLEITFKKIFFSKKSKTSYKGFLNVMFGHVWKK